PQQQQCRLRRRRTTAGPAARRDGEAHTTHQKEQRRALMRSDEDVPMSARVPADVEKPDKIVFGLTARQAAILGVTGLALWSAYQATHTLVPPALFAAVAIPIAGAAFAVVTVRRDGLTL